MSDAPHSTTGAPRWVKASAVAALAIVVLVALMLLLGGGQHGPGRHSSGDASRPPAPSPVTVSRVSGDATLSPNPGDGGGHTPPAGGHGP